MSDAPALCAEALAHLQAQPSGSPVWERSLDDARLFARTQAIEHGGDPDPMYSVEELSANGVRCVLYRPSANADDAFVWIHGGGWSSGDPESYDALTRRVANLAGCSVVSVNYRLGPEHPFPASIDDAWAAVRWACTTHERVAVGGDSAGGNLAAAVALRARDAGLALALQVLVYPVLDPELDAPFYAWFRERYAHFAGIKGFGARMHAGATWVWQQYVPDPAGRTRPDAAPMRAASLAGVAPAFIVTAEHDILRGEAEEYARRLEADGVQVTIADVEGHLHGFFHKLGVFEDARTAVASTATALRDAFAREMVA